MFFSTPRIFPLHRTSELCAAADCLQCAAGTTITSYATAFDSFQSLIRAQEDSPATLHIIIAFLLFDGRASEVTFEMMNAEGIFPRLIELIQAGVDDDAGLHRILLEVLYEMSRIQRLRMEDLSEWT